MCIYTIHKYIDSLIITYVCIYLYINTRGIAGPPGGAGLEASGETVSDAGAPGEAEATVRRRIAIIKIQRGIPRKRKSSACTDYVPALCTAARSDAARLDARGVAFAQLLPGGWHVATRVASSDSLYLL